MKPSFPMLIMLAVVLAAVSGCSQLYLFDGIVVDGDGQPIANATIVVYPLGWKRSSQNLGGGTSNNDGTFEANWSTAVGVEYFRMIVSKDGYQEHLRLVEADKKNLRIVLERSVSAEDEDGNTLQ